MPTRVAQRRSVGNGVRTPTSRRSLVLVPVGQRQRACEVRPACDNDNTGRVTAGDPGHREGSVKRAPTDRHIDRHTLGQRHRRIRGPDASTTQRSGLLLQQPKHPGTDRGTVIDDQHTRPAISDLTAERSACRHRPCAPCRWGLALIASGDVVRDRGLANRPRRLHLDRPFTSGFPLPARGAE